MAKNWYPVIDKLACADCGACIAKCAQGVYDKSKSPVPVVVNPDNCVDHCHGCGNLCPVGNAVNELFCTRDILITQKSDLYFYTEDEVERAKRSRKYCYLCEDYQPQTDNFYTYSDYFHFLKKT